MADNAPGPGRSALVKACSSRRVRLSALSLLALAAGAGVLALGTHEAMGPPPERLENITGAVRRLEIVDRNGIPLNVSYANDWNLHAQVRLHEVPEFMVTAFLHAEDRRFNEHSGQDWRARLAALAQNVRAGRAVRGASTITEQVIRMIRPRPRTIWSRWVEGWEARRLERRHPKQQILEFYLNQAPYAANRRGVAQAARYYFDRDLSALNRHEMLALAVMVRAPSRLDLWRGGRRTLNQSITQLASRLEDAGMLPQDREPWGEFDLRPPAEPADAAHFLRYVNERFGGGRGAARGASLRVTLDAGLQARLKALLEWRLFALADKGVSNGALLAADHGSGEILAWVVASAAEDTPTRLIDAVRTPRQPGSALKPFLYALVLRQGWTAATLIEDAPLADSVGLGLHSYRNYSGVFHGPVTLRQALGNSLNTPAVRAIAFTGLTAYLDQLHELGFTTLTRKTDHYGPGLALGNGEVTLLELTQAYAALANQGRYRAFSVFASGAGPAWTERSVLSPEVASLIAHILSDSEARRLEFAGSLLDFPVQTAVKTGTSSDYRDSWAVGFSGRYVVGVWMGNLDRQPTLGVTGSTGPGLVLRSAFDLLSRDGESAGLWLSPRLARREICAASGIVWREGMDCSRRYEYFLPGAMPAAAAARPERNLAVALRQPSEGLLLAYDPRVPGDLQAFDFLLEGVTDDDEVDWRVDGGPPVRRTGARYAWPLKRGEHRVSATVWRAGSIVAELEETRFTVR